MTVPTIEAPQFLLLSVFTALPLLALVVASVASLLIIYRLGEKWLLFLIVVMAMMTQHQILEGIEFFRSGGTSLAVVQETFETAANLTLAGSAYYVLSFAQKERRLARELQRSRDRYTQLVENAPSPILVVDEGRIVYANPTAEQFFGATSGDDLLGAELFEFVDPEDRPRMRTELNEAAETGRSAALSEHRFRTEDGRKRATSMVAPIVYDSGEALQLVLEDITERREYERRLDETLQNTNDGVFIVDPEADEILEANRKACEIVDYDREELVGLPVSEIHPDEMDRLQEFADAIATDGGARTEALTCQRRDGRKIPAEISGSIVEFEGRDCMLAIVRDISDRKRRERRLRVLDRILRHNLRNDMNVVIGQAEILESELSDSRLVDTAGTIKETAAGLMAMSDDLHRVQSIIDQESDVIPPTTDLGTLLEETLEEFREQYPDATISADWPENLEVRATAELRMAVEEVLENAIVHNDKSNPVVRLDVRRETAGEEWVEVRIDDNGPGIPEHERAVVTGGEEITPLRHGSGIGLWTATWIVEAFDGEVSIDESDTGGTTVQLRLKRPAEEQSTA